MAYIAVMAKKTTKRVPFRAQIATFTFVPTNRKQATKTFSGPTQEVIYDVANFHAKKTGQCVQPERFYHARYDRTIRRNRFRLGSVNAKTPYLGIWKIS